MKKIHLGESNSVIVIIIWAMINVSCSGEDETIKKFVVYDSRIEKIIQTTETETNEYVRIYDTMNCLQRTNMLKYKENVPYSIWYEQNNECYPEAIHYVCSGKPPCQRDTFIDYHGDGSFKWSWTWKTNAAGFYKRTEERRTEYNNIGLPRAKTISEYNEDPGKERFILFEYEYSKEKIVVYEWEWDLISGEYKMKKRTDYFLDSGVIGTVKNYSLDKSAWIENYQTTWKYNEKGQIVNKATSYSTSGTSPIRTTMSIVYDNNGYISELSRYYSNKEGDPMVLQEKIVYQRSAAKWKIPIGLLLDMQPIYNLGEMFLKSTMEPSLWELEAR